LNGSGTNFVSNAISTTHSYTSPALTLTLDGALAVTPTTGPLKNTTYAQLAGNFYLYVTSAGNDSGITAVITGTYATPTGGLVGQAETLTLANASIVSSQKQYYQVTSIVLSGSSAGNVSVGYWGPLTLDTPRIVLFTDGGSDSGTNAVITGTDWAG